tara:strand:- start:4673 stop:5425 length:753 start_codon:yes stop_codon:yes gene_type:complete
MNTSTQNPSATLPDVFSFNGTDLRVIDQDGQPWFTAADISRALGYVQDQQVSRIYRRNEREFKPSMTQVITLQPNQTTHSAGLALLRRGGGNLPYTARVFSPRGAHLIAMFARTEKAADFRRWVLDVLEQYQAVPPAPAPDEILAAARLSRVLLSIDGYGRSTAKALDPDACVLRVADLPRWVGEPGVFTQGQLHGLAVAALRALRPGGGHAAIQAAMTEVDDNFLLVLESDLIMSLYHSRRLSRGEANG